ncbi:MFS transporter [Streptomyces albogriseolus]|uniref:MFS transporter n=1 Tax=Streptomyces albogriseolus TaxID=1887 RepID=UPI00346115ED
MDGRRSPAWRFGWLWTAYGVSTFGTRFAFDAFALVALLVLHAGPAEVSLLAAVGPAVGAVLSVPLGPWVEYRRKRPVMIATDLVRCAVLLSVPVAYALDALTVAQLLVVSVTVAAADITFQAAVGAYVKDVVEREDLLRANGRLESTAWTATMLGPPLGGAAIGWFGPVTTVVADAVSYLLSAGALGAAGGGDRRPERPDLRPRLRAGDLLDGWRYILRDRELRPLFLNTVLVNGLIMASSPPLVVLMVGPLGFAPWQYGLAFAVPCLGGLVGARLSRLLVARFGARRVLRVAGTLRACWSVGLAFVGPGAAGLILVIVIEFGLITSMGVFNPVCATRRLERTPADRVVRTLSAWSATSKASIAVLTALWGLLASLTGPRTAIALAGALLLATPLLLPRHLGRAHQEREAEARAWKARGLSGG